MVIGRRLWGQVEGGCALDEFRSDLTDKDGCKSMDIMKVWTRLLLIPKDFAHIKEPDWTRESTIKILVDDKEIILSAETTENIRKELG
ncbi:MAG TPA: hypothetical protein ENH62_10605 [Marinobacter sp.]|nr:hypothetical protein [Marinobacter sp.]